MEIRDDTALAERTQHREASARHVGLRELPDVPMGPEPTTVPGDLPDRLRRAADQAQSRSGEWRLIHWLEDFPLAAFGQSAAAVSVGLALTFQSGILVGWALPILAVFGIGCIFLGGPQLCRELGRPAWLFRLVLALPGAELFSLTPVQDDVLCRAGRRRGKTSLEFYLAIAVTALGGGCLAALALSSGVALVWLGLLGVGLAVLAMNRMVPTAGSWVVQTMAGLGMHVAGVAGLYAVAGGTLGARAVVAGVQLGLLAVVSGSLICFRDLARDRKLGRWTVVTRFGVPAARCWVAVIALVPFTLGICWVLANVWLAALLPLVMLPLAVWTIRDVNLSVPGPIFELLRPRATGLYAAFTALLMVALMLA